MGLFISRSAGPRHRPGAAPAPPTGKVPIGDIREARALDHRLRPLLAAEAGRPAATAGELAALSLLDDLYQAVLEQHLRRRDDTLFTRVLAVLRSRLGPELLDRLLVGFAEEFLGAQISGLSMWLSDPRVGADHELRRERVVRELLVFWLLQSNPAAQPIVRQLHASPLLEIPAFYEMTRILAEVLDREPGHGTEEGSLWRLLRRPQERSPSSLSEQLELLRRIWPEAAAPFTGRLEVFLGVLAEEQAPRFGPGPGPPTEVPSFDHLGEEVRFSTDQSWMPSLVLIAKHTLVWLHQLSEQYRQPVERLDQIPESELERLAALGFNGLWLIGLWERSPASARIKQLCGNPEAAASAYSLTRYRVAEALGGEAALDELRQRAERHGIRLAADMVPNHTGLDSDWMVERPDWFIQQSHSPFPAYSFSGQNLSSREEIEVFLEDHYFDRSDAAVVFKRVDRRTGEERFVYHGNDGTSTPWNDTAQLDYLNPEVWPAVIDTIVDVARRFPIIRFDAAMTLTRKHFQRLWYPAPGTAGDIPSRAERGMSTERFRAAMPEEFWRQVVDRVAAEAPNTLLLAEAFWLMEGFFVRTLGMHRVYNSAFMNMLRDGETDKFRRLIKETLVFDPGILQRYVNFMSNPDELSAIEQFGDGDRYFGTCVVMATLPGLPMFGHGQVEGWREQYGMEYRRSYHDEPVRQDMESRHRRQIAPLLHRRQMFAGVEHFHLYDLRTESGEPCADVLAYSNGSGDRASLVLFNNSDFSVRGRLKTSVPGRDSTGEDSDQLSTVEIDDALSLKSGDFWSATDRLSGREFLFETGAVAQHGVEVEMNPWESRVLMSFRPLEMAPEWGRRLRDHLGLAGAASLEAVRIHLQGQPYREAFAGSLEPALARELMAAAESFAAGDRAADLAESWSAPLQRLAERWRLPEETVRRQVAAFNAVLDLVGATAAGAGGPASRLQRSLGREPELLPTAHAWLLLDLCRRALARQPSTAATGGWELAASLQPMLTAAGGQPEAAERCVSFLEQAMRLEWGATAPAPPARELQRQSLADPELRRALGVNQFEGREYLSREALQTFLDLRLWLEVLAWLAASEGDVVAAEEAMAGWSRALARFDEEAAASRYRTDELGQDEPESTAPRPA